MAAARHFGSLYFKKSKNYIAEKLQMNNEIISTILKRRSIRKFKKLAVPDEIITAILESGRWAPSGLNNQPWRFCIIKKREILDELSVLTSDSRIINSCNLCLSVFYNLPSGYNRDKDLMGIGACIENMLLTAESLGIGAVWLGEILKNKDKINAILEAGKDNELMAVLALGFPDEKPAGRRKKIDELIFKKI